MILVYIIKCAISLSVLYSLYGLLLRRETYYKMNRIVLVGIMLASFILPLVHVTVDNETVVHQTMSAISDQLTISAGSDAVKAQQSEARMLPLVLFLVYVLGVMALAVRYVVAAAKVCRIIISSKKEKGCYVNDSVESPFSWFNCIVISSADLHANAKELLAHERAHVQNFHSYDLLLCEIITCLQWWNPFAWMLRTDLCAVHEYEADYIVTHQADINDMAYKMLLINKATECNTSSIVNCINHYSLAERLKQMYRKPSTKAALLKVLYVLPLTAFVTFCFARPRVVGEIEQAIVREEASLMQKVASVLPDAEAADRDASQTQKREITNPSVLYKSFHQKDLVHVNSVLFTDTATIVELTVKKNALLGGVYAVGAYAYLEDANGHRCNLKRIEGYALNQFGQYISNSTNTAKLIFEPLVLDTQVFDLHVNERYTSFHLYGIRDSQQDCPYAHGDSSVKSPAKSEQLAAREKGVAVLQGRISNCLENVQPILELTPLDSTLLYSENGEIAHINMPLLVKPDGTFERSIHVDGPMMASLRIHYRKHVRDDIWDNNISEEYVCLVPGDTADIEICNSYGESHNVRYNKQNAIKNFLENVPMDLYSYMSVVPDLQRKTYIDKNQADSIVSNLQDLQKYMIWKYKLNQNERELLSQYVDILARSGRGVVSHRISRDGNIAYNIDGIEGSEVLRKMTSHLLGKYVFVNFFHSKKDVEETSNLLEDFQDSKDIAFVFVSCDSLIHDKKAYDSARKSLQAYCKDCYTVSFEEYSKLLYLVSECTGISGPGLTLNRKGEALPIHSPLGNEYNVRRSIKFLLRE